jgi:hypothetical protein
MILFSDHRDLLHTSQSSFVPAAPELCERACAMRREVMRGVQSWWLIRAAAFEGAGIRIRLLIIARQT